MSPYIYIFVEQRRKNLCSQAMLLFFDRRLQRGNHWETETEQIAKKLRVSSWNLICCGWSSSWFVGRPSTSWQFRTCLPTLRGWCAGATLDIFALCHPPLNTFDCLVSLTSSYVSFSACDPYCCILASGFSSCLAICFVWSRFVCHCFVFFF